MLVAFSGKSVTGCYDKIAQHDDLLCGFCDYLRAPSVMSRIVSLACGLIAR